MVSRRSPLLRISVFILILAMPVVLFAASEKKNEPVGTPQGGGVSIEWAAKVSGHERITLRVALPSGEVLSKTFGPGQPITFSLNDLPTVEDGAYSYELVVDPKLTGQTKKQLEAARASGDDAAARAIMRAAGLSSTVMQSGGLKVEGGMFVNPNLTEATSTDAAARVGGVTTTGIREGDLPSPSPSGTPARPGTVRVLDQVIPDDLIVQGSTCVGFDCVNNESFGFDTIRLKENNTRIKFEDTSVGSFPTNDWQLTANDSASGGSSKFSIEDITGSRVPFTVTAGASTNSIFVDSTGRVGFRTSTPVLDLHVATSNTPAIRLEQNSSGGFSAQTWDIAGNEANFFVRDVTSGSRLPFRIRPGAPTSSLDISADGEVGIGTGSPSAQLHVFSTATTDANVTIGNALTGPALNITYNGASIGRSAAAINIKPDASAVAPNPSLRLFTVDQQRMIIDNEGFIGIGTTANPDAPIHYTNGGTQARLTTGGAWQDASSRDAKENFAELTSEEAKKALDELNPVKYTYKVEPNDQRVGFIAEDVPEIVAVPDRKGLSALDIVAVLTKAVQDQQKTIDELTKKVEELQKKQ